MEYKNRARVYRKFERKSVDGNVCHTIFDGRVVATFAKRGVVNASGIMNVNPFLAAVKTQQISTLGWAWKADSTDQDALRTASGLPNDTNNNNWGSTFKAFLKN